MMIYIRYYIFLILLAFSTSCSQRQNIDLQFRSLVDSTYQQINLSEPKTLLLREISHPFSIMAVDTFLVFQEPVTMPKFTLHFFDTLLKNSTDKISLTKRLYILPLQR